MKITKYYTYSTFSEEENIIKTHNEPKEYELNLLEIPYILQLLLGVFILLDFNGVIITFTVIYNHMIALCLICNVIIFPMIVTIITDWISDTWDEKNKELITEEQQSFDNISKVELMRAKEWREKHPLEEKCRVAFENTNLMKTGTDFNSVVIAELLREVTKEKD